MSLEKQVAALENIYYKLRDLREEVEQGAVTTLGILESLTATKQLVESAIQDRIKEEAL